MVEDVIYIRAELNCNTVIDAERLVDTEIGSPHGRTIDGIPDCYARLGEQVPAHARQTEGIRVPEETRRRATSGIAVKDCTY